MTRRCDKCRFWCPWMTCQGRCRKNPPVLLPTLSNLEVAYGIWPITNDSDWCGAFDRKDVTDDDAKM